MKDFLKAYFTFTKKERLGVGIILILILCGVIIPMIIQTIIPPEKNNNIAFKSEIDSFKLNKDKTVLNNKYYSEKTKNYSKKEVASNHVKSTLFYFDPNLISLEDWLKLGVKEKTASTIKKYISKGGHFYKPEDISKIYGLHENDIKRLIPFVRIATTSKSYTTTQKLEYPKKNLISTININTADSQSLQSLPGIGPSYSKRIINFRNKLGGFYSIDQVAETYGLPDSTFQKVRSRIFLSDGNVKKININTATYDELKVHPYIRTQLANLIIQYKKQHGSFNHVTDLKNLMGITDQLYIKIEHYLSVD